MAPSLRRSVRAVLPSRSALLPETPEGAAQAMDVLTDALRIIRLKGAFFLNAEFGEPWCIAAPSGAELARVHATEADRMAICHLIVDGRCWLSVPGGDALSLEPGDVVALPHGDPHQIGSGRNGARTHPRHAVHVDLPALARERYGGAGAATSVVCGWFSYEGHLANAVMSAWPRVMRTNIRRRPSGAWLERAIHGAVAEAAQRRPGAEAMADKVAELLFFEVLRACIESGSSPQTGWLAGLRDPVVARSLALIHERPAEPWSVASLARAVASSRPVVAERFVALVGIPPMQYLTRWRVLLAAHLLRSGELNIGRIAEKIGYESEAAFNRAFKRQFGVPPGTWRRAGARTS